MIINRNFLWRHILETHKKKKPKLPVGGQKGNHSGLQHGYYALKSLLNGGRLDHRTAIYRALKEKEEELENALGGDTSPQEKALIADSVKVMLYVASLDNYLMSLSSIVRKGKVRDSLIQRIKLAGHLRENLKTLGLKRVPREVPALENELKRLQGQEAKE